MDAGVVDTAVRYHGTIHDFVILNPITKTPAPRQQLNRHSNVEEGAALLR
jgi:acetyl esterase